MSSFIIIADFYLDRTTKGKGKEPKEGREQPSLFAEKGKKKEFCRKKVHFTLIMLCGKIIMYTYFFNFLRVKLDSLTCILFSKLEQMMIWWSLLLSIGIPQAAFQKMMMIHGNIETLNFLMMRTIMMVVWYVLVVKWGEKNEMETLACRYVCNAYSSKRIHISFDIFCIDFFDSCRTNCRVLALIHNNIHRHHHHKNYSLFLLLPLHNQWDYTVELLKVANFCNINL